MEGLSVVKYQIRKANKDDALALWAVRTSSIRGIDDRYYPRADMLKWAPEEMPAGFVEAVIKYHWMLIEVAGEVVASGYLDHEKASIEAIFVKPSHQKQGYAKLIMLELEKLAKSHGFSKLSLEATLVAANFYEKMGYTSLGSGVYDSPSGLKIACIRMEKAL
jgi:ribosomal protein S18 acetylase RimI-like enzyme